MAATTGTDGADIDLYADNFEEEFPGVSLMVKECIAGTQFDSQLHSHEPCSFIQACPH